jgi:hypothetical protein
MAPSRSRNTRGHGPLIVHRPVIPPLTPTTQTHIVYTMHTQSPPPPLPRTKNALPIRPTAATIIIIIIALLLLLHPRPAYYYTLSCYYHCPSFSHAALLIRLTYNQHDDAIIIIIRELCFLSLCFFVRPPVSPRFALSSSCFGWMVASAVARRLFKQNGRFYYCWFRAFRQLSSS